MLKTFISLKYQAERPFPSKFIFDDSTELHINYKIFEVIFTLSKSKSKSKFREFSYSISPLINLIVLIGCTLV